MVYHRQCGYIDGDLQHCPTGGGTDLSAAIRGSVDVDLAHLCKRICAPWSAVKAQSRYDRDNCILRLRRRFRALDESRSCRDYEERGSCNNNVRLVLPYHA